MPGNSGKKQGRRYRSNNPFRLLVLFGYFRNFFSPQPASRIKALPRKIIVAGWKAFAPILAPLSRASPEVEGILKRINKRRKESRAIQCLFIAFEVFIAFSGNPIISPDAYTLITQSACHVRIHVNN